ncbi:uncharacterized protein ACBT44_018853 [Syngnathus typhle]
MQVCIAKLAFLALFTSYLALAAAGPGMKMTSCCTQSTLGQISAPIIGYRIQRKNLPCIRAIVFETTDGEVCSHWKQEWIMKKIMELNEARKAKVNSTPSAHGETNTTAFY